nr:myosin heavy chain, muscle-like [Penaeus vannamei]
MAVHLKRPSMKVKKIMGRRLPSRDAVKHYHRQFRMVQKLRPNQSNGRTPKKVCVTPSAGAHYNAVLQNWRKDIKTKKCGMLTIGVASYMTMPMFTTLLLPRWKCDSEALMSEVISWLETKPVDFYKRAVHNRLKRWEKCGTLDIRQTFCAEAARRSCTLYIPDKIRNYMMKDNNSARNRTAGHLTENTKKVLSYFANVGATTKKKEDEKKQNLEDQIVQTNPPLEAYGNAKTTRQIHPHPLRPNGKLSGADIEVYLLEKARVVSQAPAERGYHIFYQMMSDQVDYLKKLCHLSDDIYDYRYECQGKVTVPSIDDKEDMEFTHNAFTILNFTNEERDSCYKVTAAVMHHGNMKFKQRGREEQAEPDGTDAGDIVATIMGVESEELYRNFCKPKIKVGAEFVTQGRNVDQVYYSISAMAKGLFDRLFKWIVKKCNQTLETGMKRAMFIGVLDIAGFEIFDFNGFEQICINFCNEKLQQFFNHHMFVLEQEEYKAEGIDWVFVDFGMDLQACIELFEKKLGLLAILEEESMFPKATDKSFEEKLKANHLGKSPCFIKPKPPKAGQAEGHFAIVHYAGTVTYNLSGWLEKNKDPLNDTVVDQLKKSKMDLVVELFADHPGQSAPAEAKGGKKKKTGGFKTVSSGYREQLNSLMTTLHSTHPHFVRCIVPNETKSPGVVEAGLIMHQLTCNGVLEGIRICQKGFPNRMQYPDFKHRYKILAADVMATEKDDKKAAEMTFQKSGLDKELYRCGKTKVFFRAGVLGTMEELRDERLAKIITWMQSWIRGLIGRKEYGRLQEQRVSLVVLQRNIRKYMDMSNWSWFIFWQKVKPLINQPRIEDEINKLKDRAEKAVADLDRECTRRKELEESNVSLAEELNTLKETLESTKGNVSKFIEEQAKISAAKADLEAQLSDASARLQKEEENRTEMFQLKRKAEQDVNAMRKDLEDFELNVQKTNQDKAQIRNINDEISHQMITRKRNFCRR